MILCGIKFLRDINFAYWRLFVIFAIRTDWFFLLGINFCDFQKVPVPSIDNISIFIEYLK